jgi:caspase domain-containing protein
MVFRAILIGNSRFERDDGLPNLAGPANDVVQLAAALCDPKFGVHATSEVHAFTDLSSQEMRMALSHFLASADSDAQSLIYYSGHGRRDTQGRLYLCATDTQSDKLEATAVSSASISVMADNSCGRSLVVVLDCCYAGAFKGGEIPIDLLGSGRFILSGCRANQLAQDASEPGACSPFTACLVECLLTPDSIDDNKDGFVSLDELYVHVSRRVRKISKQVPQRSFDRAVGAVILAKRSEPTKNSIAGSAYGSIPAAGTVASWKYAAGAAAALGIGVTLTLFNYRPSPTLPGPVEPLVYSAAAEPSTPVQPDAVTPPGGARNEKPQSSRSPEVDAGLRMVGDEPAAPGLTKVADKQVHPGPPPNRNRKRLGTGEIDKPVPPPPARETEDSVKGPAPARPPPTCRLGEFPC